MVDAKVVRKVVLLVASTEPKTADTRVENLAEMMVGRMGHWRVELMVEWLVVM